MRNTCFSRALSTFAVLLVPIVVACGDEEQPSHELHDQDGDGIVDELDSCPSQPEVINNYQDLDGCPDTITGDADGDGVPTGADQCPGEPETVNGYQDGDGCPDTPPSPPLDTDRDGIPDASDSCPAAAETVNGNRDADGCPDLTGLYTGSWSGTATLQFENEAPWFNNTVVMTGAVNADRVTMTPVCPLSDGALTTNIYTDQFRASWGGAMNCAPIAFTSGCQFVVLTYQAAAFSLSTDGRTLGAAGGGTATGCGITKAFQMLFSGVRQ
jgi:hypothetical protein